MTDSKMVGLSGYARHPNDLYETPDWVTETLLDYLNVTLGLPRTIWEPACGNGAMVRVLETRFKKVYATDIDQDFLTCPALLPGTDYIITNPPYGRMQDKFLDHALSFGVPVCFLLRNEFDSGARRRRFFEKNFHAKIVLTKRPRWIKGSTGAPRHNYAWFIWNKNHATNRIVHAYGKTFV